VVSSSGQSLQVLAKAFAHVPVGHRRHLIVRTGSAAGSDAVTNWPKRARR
jgi:hypothetical protein